MLSRLVGRFSGMAHPSTAQRWGLVVSSFRPLKLVELSTLSMGDSATLPHMVRASSVARGSILRDHILEGSSVTDIIST